MIAGSQFYMRKNLIYLGVILVMLSFIILLLTASSGLGANRSVDLRLRGAGLGYVQNFFTKFPKINLSDLDLDISLSGNINYKAVSVRINTDFIKHVTDTNFVSVALDTILIYRRWEKLNLR